MILNEPLVAQLHLAEYEIIAQKQKTIDTIKKRNQIFRKEKPSIIRYIHMFTSDINNVTIIGAGLVGSAVLREMVRGWARTQKGPTQQDAHLRYSEIRTISFTARSESRLIHQIQKTKDVLSREECIIVEQDSPLTLTISSASRRFYIEADLLDILPQGLTSSTIDDEIFRKASPLYSFLANKRPDILIIGVNLATKMKEIQNLVLAWTLTTLKQAADEFNMEAVVL